MNTGEAESLSPLVTRVVAPNPGPLTGPGTNTYIVGTGPVVVVDPGPEDASHIDAICAAIGDATVSAILVSHHHPDHWPGAPALAERVGARVYGQRHTGDFRPDVMLRSGGLVAAGGGRMRALATPGHASDHLCFVLEEEQALFSGDHVMAGSTVVVAPPDGDMAAYVRSLRHLRTLGLKRIYPGHGHVLDDPAAVLDYYVAHRLQREEAIADAVSAGHETVPAIVAVVYTDVPEVMHDVARYSVLAHLLKLRDEGRVAVHKAPGEHDDTSAGDTSRNPELSGREPGLLHATFVGVE